MSKYKYGKQKKMQDKEAFAEIMEKAISILKEVYLGYLVLIYYTGCRVSEILKLTTEDFKVNEGNIEVRIKASKKGVERPPFFLNHMLPFIEWIKVAYFKPKKGERVFPFSRQTAWRIVKRVMPEHYPHFFRLSRCVSFLDRGVPLNKIRIWFGWKRISTVENYLGYSSKTTEELSKGLE